MAERPPVGAGAGAGGCVRRFVLERYPVRVIWTRLEQAWSELRSYQHYPPAVEALLGEAVTASVLLAATLKFQGDSLAACLENYFATSEQLPTRIALAADGNCAAGVLLQKMPPPSSQGESLAAAAHQVWEDLQLN